MKDTLLNYRKENGMIVHLNEGQLLSLYHYKAYISLDQSELPNTDLLEPSEHIELPKQLDDILKIKKKVQQGSVAVG